METQFKVYNEKLAKREKEIVSFEEKIKDYLICGKNLSYNLIIGLSYGFHNSYVYFL